MRRILFPLLLTAMVLPAQAARLKDIVAVRGAGDTPLVGYGLVVDLSGTGDTLRNSLFTEQALQSMLNRMGIRIRNGGMRTRNVAAVLVTADLSPQARRGARVDVAVSSLGDAASLMGGTLVLTQLAGPDGIMHVLAQGPLVVSGFAATGQAEQISQGVPTAGRIPNGGAVEAPATVRDSSSDIVLELKNPDHATAIAVADAINTLASARYRGPLARDQDQRTIVVRRPLQVSATRFIAEIGDLDITPDMPARVVIDARTGTIVIGQDVRIATVAVTHGSISVRITETPQVSQPQPLSNGRTVTTPQTAIEAEQTGGQLAIVGGANLRALVRGLNQIGLKPTGIIAILQAIRSAGALQAELIVQ